MARNDLARTRDDLGAAPALIPFLAGILGAIGGALVVDQARKMVGASSAPAPAAAPASGVKGVDSIDGLGFADLGALYGFVSGYHGYDLGGGAKLDADALMLKLSKAQRKKMVDAINAGMTPAEIFVAAGLPTGAAVAQAQSKPDTSAPAEKSFGAKLLEAGKAAAAAMGPTGPSPGSGDDPPPPGVTADTPSKKDCGCAECKHDTLKGRGEEVCDYGCGPEGCPIAGLAGDDASGVAGADDGDVGWAKNWKMFGYDYEVKAEKSAPAPGPTPIVPDAKAKGVSGWASEGDLGNLAGLGDDILDAASKATGAAAGIFVPGVGPLVTKGIDKLHDVTNKATGHDPNSGHDPAGKTPGNVKGADDMSERDGDLGALLPGKPTKKAFGAHYRKAGPNAPQGPGWYWPAVGGAPGFETATKKKNRINAYTKALAAWKVKQLKFNKAKAGLTSKQAALIKRNAWLEAALATCQAQGSVLTPEQYDDPYAYDPSIDDGSMFDSYGEDDYGEDDYGLEGATLAGDDDATSGADDLEGAADDLGATPAQKAAMRARAAKRNAVAHHDHAEVAHDRGVIMHEKGIIAQLKHQLADARRGSGTAHVRQLEHQLHTLEHALDGAVKFVEHENHRKAARIDRARGPQNDGVSGAERNAADAPAEDNVGEADGTAGGPRSGASRANPHTSARPNYGGYGRGYQGSGYQSIFADDPGAEDYYGDLGKVLASSDNLGCAPCQGRVPGRAPGASIPLNARGTRHGSDRRSSDGT